jgi:P27 family predicted phage terminase small subunit
MTRSRPKPTLKAPDHFGPATALWWRETVTEYGLEEHRVRLLTMAAEAWDMYQNAREQLARDGLVVEGREGGIRPHPCVAIARDNRAAFAALVKQIGLDIEEGPERGPGRPSKPVHWPGYYASTYDRLGIKRDD